MSAKDDLEAIFNAIPKDGSNIKDEEDDNGYDSVGGDNTITFDEKVAEVASKLAAAPAPPAVAVTIKEPEIPKPAPAPEPVAPPVEEPAKTQPTGAAEIDDLLSESLTAKPAPKPVASAVADGGYDSLGDELGVEATPPAPEAVEEEKVSAPAPAQVEEAPPAPEAEVPPLPTASIPFKTVEEKTLKSDDSSDDKSGSGKPDLSGFLDGNGEFHQWALESPNEHAAKLYAMKRKYLPMMLIGGRLNFRRFRKELIECNANANVSMNLHDMFEKMVEIQGFKDRVREIQVDASDQYFIWSRFMDMFRAEAARVENTKVALASAAALIHLWDFDAYFAALESLYTLAEKVMKTLDSALVTVSRGVTIALPERGFERHETGSFASMSNTSFQSQQKPVQPTRPAFQQAPAGSDSFDAKTSSREPAKKAGGFDWGDVR